MANKKQQWRRSAISVAVMLACASGGASAYQFESDSGWKGAWNTNLSVGASWRMEDQAKDLVPRTAVLSGMVKGNPKDYSKSAAGKNVGNLNYDKGDLYSQVYKFLTELSLSKGDTAILVRAKGWYDEVLKNGDVPWGNMAGWGGLRPASATAAQWNKPLSDSGAPNLSRFAGVALLDAYVSQNFELGDASSQVRFGRQVINWGEGLFIRGINANNAIDVAAARRAGAEIKEALLPTLALQASTSLPIGASLEGYYQLKWEPSAAEYCGTFWNMAHLTLAPSARGCNVMEAQAISPLGNTVTMQGRTASPPYAAGALFQTKGDKPDRGDWGLALRFPVEALDTEFGVYAMNVSTTLPHTTVKAPVAGAGFLSLAGNLGVPGVTPATMQLNYTDNIPLFGVSAATNLAGWAIGAELSHQQDVPVNYYTEDMKNALGTSGPLTTKFKSQLAGKVGKVVSVDMYERFDKTQLTLNALNSLTGVARALGATQAVVVGEVGFESNNVPDYKKAGNPRFGRNGPAARAAGIVYSAASDPCADTGSKYWCKNDGFVTDFSWGYRLRGQLSYANFFGTSWELKPSLFFAHDVQGVSMDGQFQEDRKTVGLGLEFNLDKKHTVNVNYTTYAGKWNLVRDHDNLGVSYAYSF